MRSPGTKEALNSVLFAAVALLGTTCLLSRKMPGRGKPDCCCCKTILYIPLSILCSLIHSYILFSLIFFSRRASLVLVALYGRWISKLYVLFFFLHSYVLINSEINNYSNSNAPFFFQCFLDLEGLDILCVFATNTGYIVKGKFFEMPIHIILQCVLPLPPSMKSEIQSCCLF